MENGNRDNRYPTKCFPNDLFNRRIIQRITELFSIIQFRYPESKSIENTAPYRLNPSLVIRI